MAPRPLIAGNWKMNGLLASEQELQKLIGGVAASDGSQREVLVCPPFTLLQAFAKRAAGSAVGIGAQDCHPNLSGAHTGDISAQMIKDVGGTSIIVGHSERRTDHGESSDLVKQKAKAAQDEGLTAIICVGETEAERDAGQAWSVVSDQVSKSLPSGSTASNTVIAYEPVWAIGTGRTPTIDDIAAMHDDLRTAMVGHLGDDGNSVRLLYGGSMKPGNATEILAVTNVNGGLVGGASLKAEDFLAIISAAS